LREGSAPCPLADRAGAGIAACGVEGDWRRCRPAQLAGRAGNKSLGLEVLAAETFITPAAQARALRHDHRRLCAPAGPTISQEATRISPLSLVAAGLGVTLVPQSMRRLRVHGVTGRSTMPLIWSRAAQPRLSPGRELGGGRNIALVPLPQGERCRLRSAQVTAPTAD
jgi:hypothetical protein